MDLPTLVSGKPGQEQKPSIEYAAQAASPLVNGEVRLKINEKALIMTALFDAAEIPFAEINALIYADYATIVKADSGDYVLSKMGNWCQPFYDELRNAYNKAVLRSLFIKDEPILTAMGSYCYNESGVSSKGMAFVHVYDNSIVVLPPDLDARRIPLCFVSGMVKGDYELTLNMNSGETYTFSKLGFSAASLTDAVEKQIRELREKSLAAIKELDSCLATVQASQIAKLMPQGMSAQFGQLAAIAPSFIAALEAKLADTRAAESYLALKELCDPSQVYIGFKKNEAFSGVSGDNNDNGQTEAIQPDPYLLWLVVPSPDEQYAVVEFAQADSATFVYRITDSFHVFAQQLNRALEAIDFKRDVIRMAQEELLKPENADYYMAAKRTAALQFVRQNFVGRIIHSSTENWKRKLIELWSGEKVTPPQATYAHAGTNYCVQCGAVLTASQNFCGNCGWKI